MRIHVHNSHVPNPRTITTADFGPADLAAHDVSFGNSRAEYEAVAEDVEILLTATGNLPILFPLVTTRLRVISCMSAGLEILAPFDWLPDGVILLNNSGTHAAKAAEYAAMALLMLANRMPALIDAQHRGAWRPIQPSTLAGKRLTIVGLGAIGQACARTARGLGMAVTGVRRSAGHHTDCDRVIVIPEIAQVLPDTDYLLATLPLTSETRMLIDAAMLAQLPAGAGVVNIGRGGVLDEAALCAELNSGRLGGAVLDVFEKEPLAADSPLWTTPGLIVTPHMSADDPASHNRMTVRIMLDNLRALEEGRDLPNAFDPIAGTRRRTA